MSRPLRPSASLAACALALFAQACIYPAERGRALETRVDRLADENEALKKELESQRATLDATIPRVDAKIAEVTKALSSLDQASRRTDADTNVLVQKTIEDVAALRGQLETQLHELQQMRDALSRVQEETERKILSMMSPEQLKAYEARKKLEALEKPKEPKAFLALARQKAGEGEEDVARRLYDEFFRTWPQSPLAGEAHFGLGEVWFGQGRCREALFEYGKVIQEHPKTPSAPEAFLRSSECFAKLKMNAESKLALEELLKNHPRSGAAKTAKARLAELDKDKKDSKKKKGRRR